MGLDCFGIDVGREGREEKENDGRSALYFKYSKPQEKNAPGESEAYIAIALAINRTTNTHNCTYTVGQGQLAMPS